MALVGENGAGKSTLALLLARLYEPTTGCIRVDGVDLREIDAAVWQQQIGFVFQRFTSYEATVRENIAYGNWPYLSQHPDEVEQLARLAQVATLIERLPDGYETLLGKFFAKRDFSTISMADRILVLEKGQLIEVGSHKELMARAGHYARLYHLHHQLIPGSLVT